MSQSANSHSTQNRPVLLSEGLLSLVFLRVLATPSREEDPPLPGQEANLGAGVPPGDDQHGDPAKAATDDADDALTDLALRLLAAVQRKPRDLIVATELCTWLQRELATASGPVVTKTERGFRVAFGGKTAELGVMKGLRILKTLLEHPGRSFTAIEVEADGDPPGSPGDLLNSAEKPEGEDSFGDYGAQYLPVSDQEALRAYHRRGIELQSAIDEARRYRDWARLPGLEDELERLQKQMRDDKDRFDRVRSIQATKLERARQAVRQAVKRAYEALEGQDIGVLVAYLKQTVKTGNECSYTPASF